MTMTSVNSLRSPYDVPLAGATGSASTSVAPAETFLPAPQDLLSTLICSGDPGAELAALAVKSGESQQKIAQTGRDAEQKLEVEQDHQQVAALHQKADAIRSDGILEGVGMMAQGAFDLGAAGEITPQGKPTAAGDALKAEGIVVLGESKVAGAFAKGDEANLDAAAAEHKSASDQAKSAADDWHDAKKTGGELISAALDFYREYTSAQASASAAALHRA